MCNTANMTAAPYLIEISKSEGRLSPGVKSPLGFELVDLLYENVPSDVKPAATPIQVLSRITPSEELPDHFADLNGFHVVSDRMRTTIEPLLKNVAFHAATVELTKPGGRDTDIGGGPTLNGYWWLHCWNLLDLVSRDSSDVTEYPFRRGSGDMSVRFATWRKIVLNELPNDEHYFGLKGLKGGRRFFSPELWKMLQQKGVKVYAKPMLLDTSLSNERRMQIVGDFRKSSP